MATTRQLAATDLRWRVGTVSGLMLVVFAWAASRGPLAQDQAYHHFADQRRLHGVPHFWNVVSNLPFAAIGLLGCWWLIVRRAPLPHLASSTLQTRCLLTRQPQ